MTSLIGAHREMEVKELTFHYFFSMKADEQRLYAWVPLAGVSAGTRGIKG